MKKERQKTNKQGIYILLNTAATANSSSYCYCYNGTLSFVVFVLIMFLTP